MQTTPPSAYPFRPRLGLMLGMGLSLAAFFLLPLGLSARIRLLAAWDIGVAGYLLLAWRVLARGRPEDHCRQIAARRREGLLIVVSAVLVAFVSLTAILFMLTTARHAGFWPTFSHVVLATLAVAGAWLLIHTWFSFHYAHRYWCGRAGPAGGLAFPHDRRPSYFDFVYFAFVIGMTFQVSDVQVQSETMRRLVLFHALVSFVFNLVILALTINAIGNLL